MLYGFKSETYNFKINLTSRRKNRIARCLLDSEGILATMYVDNVEKEQRKVAGIRRNNY